MMLFRICLAMLGSGLAVYTGFVVTNFGWNFLPFYFSDLVSMSWPGQFNLDFTILILLSAGWILWRNRCSRASIALVILLIPFVSMLLTAYLLYLSWRERGDLSAVLIGDRNRTQRGR